MIVQEALRLKVDEDHEHSDEDAKDDENGVDDNDDEENVEDHLNNELE